MPISAKFAFGGPEYRADRHADRLKRRAARAAARGLGLAAIGIVYGAPTLLHCVDGQCG